MSYDEARIRNHFHFNELSGGILLDQGIHMIDVCNWALQSTLCTQLEPAERLFDFETPD